MASRKRALHTRFERIGGSKEGGRQSRGKGKDQLSSPFGVCLAGDYLVVADNGNHRVQVFSKEEPWSLARSFGTGVAGSTASGTTIMFNHPMSTAFHSQRNWLCVSDSNNHRIVVLNFETGKLVGIIGGPLAGNRSDEFDFVQGICLDDTTSTLFVCDNKNHRVQVFHLGLTGSGELSTQYSHSFGICGSPGLLPHQFNSPVAICHCNGLLFVSDWNNDRVQVLQVKTGRCVHSIGRKPHAENGVSAGISTNGNGNGTVGVGLVGSGGAGGGVGNGVSTLAGDSFGSPALPASSTAIAGESDLVDDVFASPYGVCVDSLKKLLYIVDSDNHRVQIFRMQTSDPNAAAILSFEYSRTIGNENCTSGSELGQLYCPREICVDPKTNIIYIADKSNHRILIDTSLSVNRSIENALSKSLTHPVLAALATVVNSDYYADMWLVVDGERLPAHKLILLPRSSVLRQHFEGNVTANHSPSSPLFPASTVNIIKAEVAQNNTSTMSFAEFYAAEPVLDPTLTAGYGIDVLPESNEVHVLDTDPVMIRELLIYLYTGQCSFLAPNSPPSLRSFCPDLLRLAIRFDIPSLQRDCESTLLSSLTAASSASLLSFAEALNRPQLMESILSFITTCPRAVIESTGFKELAMTNPRLLVKITSRLAQILP